MGAANKREHIPCTLMNATTGWRNVDGGQAERTHKKGPPCVYVTEYGSTIHNNWLVWPFVGPFPFFSSAFHTWTDSYLLSHGWHSRAVDQFLTLIRGYENSVAKERRRWNPKMIELCSLKTRSIKRLSVRPQRDDGVLRTLMGTLSARVCVFGWPTALTPLWKLCEPRTKKCTIIYWLIYGLVPRKCAHVWKQCRQCAFTAGLCVEVNLIPANLDRRALPDFAYAVNVRVVGVDIIGLNVYRLMLVVSCWRIRVMCEHKPIVRGATSVSARFLFMSFSDGFMVHKAEQRWKENQNGSLPTFSMRRTARRTAPIKAASECRQSSISTPCWSASGGLLLLSPIVDTPEARHWKTDIWMVASPREDSIMQDSSQLITVGGGRWTMHCTRRLDVARAAEDAFCVTIGHSRLAASRSHTQWYMFLWLANI